jgi:hypothetical protein
MVTNNNKRLVDLPTWQLLRQVPTANTAISATCTSDDGLNRYIYYVVGAAFWRYDTTSDQWTQLSTTYNTPATFARMRYSKHGGYYGRVIATPSSTTLQIPGLNGNVLGGYKIRIISGVGAGQERTIVSVAESVKHDHGLATTASNSSLSDSTKKWKMNQWAGYQVRITYGTGNTQVRKILYSDATSLTWALNNSLCYDSFGNQITSTTPVTTAGSQAHFVIESSVATVDSAWTINPDYSSKFKVLSGGIWLLSSASAAPFYSLQYYDVAADMWQVKQNNASLVIAAFGTDGTLERTGEIMGNYLSGTATSGGNFKLTDTSKSLTLGKYNNFRIRITGGTGVGQNRRIVYSGSNYFEVARKWEVNPDATSTYGIVADVDKIYIAGNGNSSMLQYDVDSGSLIQGSKYDDGMVNAMCIQYPGIDQFPIAVSTATRSTGGITAVNPVPTVAGTGYVVGEILTVTTGGTNGKAIVESVGTGGAVTGISLLRAGATYTTGTGKATTASAAGINCTIEITTIGTVGRIARTGFSFTFMRIGEQIKFSGAVEAAWNTTYTIIGADDTISIDVVTTATANAVAAGTISVNAIVDASKNWDVDEHKGKLVEIWISGTTPTTQCVPITSNTATTLTVPAITLPVAGTYQYVITSPVAIGRDDQEKVTNKQPDGVATGGSTTTLVDSTKNMTVGQWIGARLRILTGTGRGADIAITGNDSTTFTYATQTFTPDATTTYMVMDTSGVASAGATTSLTDATKNWKVNQWAGKRVRILGGTGLGNEVSITSNTATVLTYATQTFTPDTTTVYTILGIPARGAGIELIWLFGGVSLGQFMFLPRGGVSNTADRYDITTEKWEYGVFFSPQFETLTTGSMYAYDGVNNIYFTKDATGRIYDYDVVSDMISGAGQIPGVMGTALIGNRMDICTSDDGIDYLYIQNHTGSTTFGNAFYRVALTF